MSSFAVEDNLFSFLVKLNGSGSGDLTAVAPVEQAKATLDPTSNLEGMTAAQLFTPSEVSPTWLYVVMWMCWLFSPTCVGYKRSVPLLSAA